MGASVCRFCGEAAGGVFRLLCAALLGTVEGASLVNKRVTSVEMESLGGEMGIQVGVTSTVFQQCLGAQEGF